MKMVKVKITAGKKGRKTIPKIAKTPNSVVAKIIKDKPWGGRGEGLAEAITSEWDNIVKLALDCEDYDYMKYRSSIDQFYHQVSELKGLLDFSKSSNLSNYHVAYEVINTYF